MSAVGNITKSPCREDLILLLKRDELVLRGVRSRIEELSKLKVYPPRIEEFEAYTFMERVLKYGKKSLYMEIVLKYGKKPLYQVLTLLGTSKFFDVKYIDGEEKLLLGDMCEDDKDSSTLGKINSYVNEEFKKIQENIYNMLMEAIDIKVKDINDELIKISNDEVQMPEYKCMKIVRALKIKYVDRLASKGNESNGSAVLIFEEKAYEPIRISFEYMHRHNVMPGGYFVRYEDGSESYMSEIDFVKDYVRATTEEVRNFSDAPKSYMPKRNPVQMHDEDTLDDGLFSFGEALRILEDGGLVARKGWNGKGMYLMFVEADGYELTEKTIKKLKGKSVDAPMQRGWIGMKTADNRFVPWVASQAEVLANDWVTVTKEVTV